MINKVILIGNVGNLPDVVFTANGMKYAKFSLATNESYRDKSGQKVTNTEWHYITVWGYLADYVENYVFKGSKLYIEGKLSYSTYEKNGVKIRNVEIIPTILKSLNAVQKNEEKQPKRQEATKQHVSPQQVDNNFSDDGIDDLPF